MKVHNFLSIYLNSQVTEVTKTILVQINHTIFHNRKFSFTYVSNQSFIDKLYLKQPENTCSFGVRNVELFTHD